MKVDFTGGELSGMTRDVADTPPQFYRNLVIHDGDKYVETYERRDFVRHINNDVVLHSEYVFVRYES